MELSIIIPWQNKGADQRYQEAVDFVVDHYRGLDIGEVVIGTYPVDDKPLNRSRLRNDGASRATGDVLAFIDAEILIPTPMLLEAARLALEAPGVVFPLSYGWTFTTPEETEKIYAGEPFENFIRTPAHNNYYQFGRDYVARHWMVAPAGVISREGFDKIGGWDEEFEGWGEEDRDFNWRAHHLLGKLRTVEGGFIHINHTDEQSKVDNHVYFTEGTPEREQFLANVARFQRKALAVYRPKIAVYAAVPPGTDLEYIANWAKSAQEADEIHILLPPDGDLGPIPPDVEIHWADIDPWRADDAWNAALDALPEDIDICVPLRHDEKLMTAGWREALEDSWLQGADRFMCRYRWPDGGTAMLGRIHIRHEWRWRNPVREVIDGQGVTLGCALGIISDGSGRTDDPGLLRQMVETYPDDANALFAYGSQLFHGGEWVEGRELLVRYLRVGASDQERAEACLMMADMVFDRDREQWLLRAAGECPLRREPWERLADHYLMHRMEDEARGAASRLLRIQPVPLRNDAFRSALAWDDGWVRKTYLEQEPPPLDGGSE